MRPRFVGRLSLADCVTVGNAALGFLAAAAAAVDPGVAARLVLLAGVADGLDGVLARRYGASAAGTYLDSLADVASFGVAPALLVAAVARDAWPVGSDPVLAAAAYGGPALFVAMAVVRLGLYTALDSEADTTEGVQTTLAATILAAATLAGFVGAASLVGLSVVLAVAMVLTVTYPDLHPQDAVVMGLVQVLAVVLQGWFGEAFAFALLFLALAYMTLGPWFYWESEQARPARA
jgi:CDP-diacylglycerol--serine O-phosphatidyltransferase